MRKPVLTIFYQFDPWCPSIGGIQTVISSFIKYASSKFELRLVGTSNDTNLHIGKWQEAELAGTEIALFRLQRITLEAYCPILNTAALFGRCLA